VARDDNLEDNRSAVLRVTRGRDASLARRPRSSLSSAPKKNDRCPVNGGNLR